MTERLVVGELSLALVAAGAVCGSPWLAPAAVVAAAGLSVAATGVLPPLPRARRRDSASGSDGPAGTFPYGRGPTTSYPYEDRGRRIVGMAGDGTSLTTVVRVDPADGTGLQPAHGAGQLPLSLLPEALDVDGIALASAQVVQQVRGGGPAGAPAVRLTWVALRLEPGLSPVAVAARGGGLGGAQRCLVRAADQMAAWITGAGLRAVVLDQEDFDTALGTARCAAAAAGSNASGQASSGQVGPPPGEGGHLHGTYAVRGACEGAAALLAAPPGRATTLGITVRRGALRGPVETVGHVRITAADERELGAARQELERAARAARITLVRTDPARRSGVLGAWPWGGAAR
ncbi:type VII secretion protein EccE [Streptomyces sp. NPDC004111]|uniref:type VII secretion protein EccE n=1 Tax=Streptomyces sp. NPDC004111 TaxID=3364690 RepID=UPI003691A812